MIIVICDDNIEDSEKIQDIIRRNIIDKKCEIRIKTPEDVYLLQR